MSKQTEDLTLAVKRETAEPLDVADVLALPDAPVKRSYSTEELAALKAKGLSLAAVGKIVGLSKQAVCQRLQAHKVTFDKVERFRKDKSFVLHDKQRILLERITESEVAKMKNIRDVAVSFGILYDKGRLEEGLSTNNIASWVGVVQQAHKGEVDVTPEVEA